MENLDNLGNINLNIELQLSNNYRYQLKSSIREIEIAEFTKLKKATYIIFRLYFALEKTKICNEITEQCIQNIAKNCMQIINVQPQISNYIIFNSQVSMDNYLSEEMNGDSLYLTSEVKNGKIELRYS